MTMHDIVDSGMYVVSVFMAGKRAASNEDPFDFEDPNTLEYITNKVVAFIKDPDMSLDTSHNIFLARMSEDGWKYGEQIDTKAKLHPHMVPFEKLSEDDLNELVQLAAIVRSAIDFVSDMEKQLKADIYTKATKAGYKASQITM